MRRQRVEALPTLVAGRVDGGEAGVDGLPLVGERLGLGRRLPGRLDGLDVLDSLDGLDVLGCLGCLDGTPRRVAAGERGVRLTDRRRIDGAPLLDGAAEVVGLLDEDRQPALDAIPLGAERHGVADRTRRTRFGRRAADLVGRRRSASRCSDQRRQLGELLASDLEAGRSEGVQADTGVAQLPVEHRLFRLDLDELMPEHLDRTHGRFVGLVVVLGEPAGLTDLVVLHGGGAEGVGCAVIVERLVHGVFGPREVARSQDDIEVLIELEQLEAVAVQVEIHAVDLDRATTTGIGAPRERRQAVHEAIAHVRRKATDHRDQRVQVDSEAA